MENFKGTKGEWHVYFNSQGYNSFCIGNKYKVVSESEQEFSRLLISKAPRMLFRLASNRMVLENTVTYLKNLLAIVEPHDRLKLDTNILLLESEIIDTGELIKQATEL